MSQEQLSLTNIINYFAGLAANHKQINSFFYGPKWDVSVSETAIYPIMLVIPQTSKLRKDSIVLRHKIQILDQVSKDETNLNVLLSDNFQTLLDIKAYIDKDFFYDMFPSDDSDMSPYFENYDDGLGGWSMDLELQLDWLAGVCDIPGLYPSGVTFQASGNFYSVNLAQYLPLAGGQLTGPLTGTTAYFNDYFSGGTELSQVIYNIASSVKGNLPYLPLSGGTLTGALSGTTYYGDGSHLTGISTKYVTGFTNTNNVFTITDNTNTNFNTTLSTLTGLTVNGLLNVSTISATTYQGLPVTTDTYVTGFTFTPSNYNLTIYQNNNVSPLTTNLGIIGVDVTGGTYNSSNGCVTFITNSGGTFTVCGFLTGYTNTFVSGFTYDNNNNLSIYQTQNDPTLKVNISQMSGLTVNGTLKSTTISATTYQNLPFSVFTTGTSGTYSIAANNGTAVSTGNYSVSEGYQTSATTSYSHAEGQSTSAGGSASHAEGFSTKTTGSYTHAEGSQTSAGGSASHAEGQNTTSNGTGTHAEGNYTTASGSYSHAEGSFTIANATNASHAEGYYTTASGNQSHAGGAYSKALGINSFVHGSGSTASGTTTIVLGDGITGGSANTVYVNSLNIKNAPTGTATKILEIDVNGNVIANVASTDIHTTAFTYTSSANTLTIYDNWGNSYSTAINSMSGLSITNTLKANTISATTYQNLPISPSFSGWTGGSVSYSIVANNLTGNLALAPYTISEGDATSAGINAGILMTSVINQIGLFNSSYGDITSQLNVNLNYGVIEDTSYANLVGSIPVQSGPVGLYLGVSSLTGGFNIGDSVTSTSGGNGQVYQNNTTSILIYDNSGTFNIGDTVTDSNTSDTFVITSLNSFVNVSNSFSTIPTLGTSLFYNTLGTIIDTKPIGSNSHAEGQLTSAIGSSHSEGLSTTAIGGSHSEGQNTLATNTSHAEGYGTTAQQSSHAEGQNTTALVQSHAEGINTQANSTGHAEGNGTTANGGASHSEGLNTKALGAYAHAEGQSTTANGIATHSEGYNTVANNTYSHAEGQQTTAYNGSHSEGYNTTASGIFSHSEGYSTKSFGNYGSHAGGYNSIASGQTSFVHGYNSRANGATTIVLGDNLTGNTSNTVYVNSLNIKTLTGSSINYLGITSGGTIVTASTPTSVYSTAFTNTNNVFTLTNSTGGTLSTTLNTLTGLTVNGSLSATTISGGTEYINRLLVNASTNNLTNPERLLVNDGGTGGTGYSNTIVGIASVNNYAQLNINNQYSGNNASSDVVATADNGNESINYIDMGINSSTFNQNYVGGANDAYVYSTGNNLYLGNISTGKTVNIFVGGSNVATTGNTTTIFSTGNTTSYVPFYTPTISATTYLNLNTNAWSPQGNSGLTAGTYFLGTKDNNGLMFKTNNQQSGYIDITTNNTSFGVGTLTAITSANTYNVAIGYNAAQNISSTGSSTGFQNVAIGANALKNNINGYSNVAIGYNALTSMNNGTAGTNQNAGHIAIGALAMANATPTVQSIIAIGYSALGVGGATSGPTIAIGRNALNQLTSGQSNIAIGSQTLQASTADFANTALGHTVFASLNGGSYNTAMGYQAGNLTTTGGYNLFLGYGSGYYNTTGSYNTFVGTTNVTNNNVTGSYNTTLGAYIPFMQTGLTNSITIGYNASATTSNTIQLGNSSISGLTIGTGGLSTIAQSPNLYINSSGQVYQSSLNLANTYWSLLGNSGTTAGTNFIGTTDAKALIFKTNNQTSGILDPVGYNVGFGTGSLTGYTSASTYNVGIGYNALPITSGGTYNIAIGANALSINTGGSNNIAIGQGALKVFAPNNGGGLNIAIGQNALAAWAQGTSNGNTQGAVAIGYNSQAAANSAIANTSVGYNSMASLTTGQLNAAFGRGSMQNYNALYGAAFGASSLSAAAGNYNSAFGYGSGTNTTGTGNSFFGAQAGGQNTSGSYNTFVGAPVAGVNPNNIVGSYNTTLGYGADTAYSALTNATAIGYSAQSLTSNSIQLGNPSVTGLTIGNGGLATSTNSANLYYNPSTGLVSVSPNSFTSFYVSKPLGQTIQVSSFAGGASYQYYWWQFTGNTTNGLLNRGFSGGTNGTITYTGASNTYFEVDIQATVTPQGATSFYFGLLKNVTGSTNGLPAIQFPSSGTTNYWSATTNQYGGIVANDSIQYWGVTSANNAWPIASSSVIQLNTGDILGLGIAFATSSAIQATTAEANIKLRQI